MNPLYMEIFNQGAPWALLVMTLTVGMLIGDVHPKVWIVAAIAQVLWIAYVVYTKDWHVLPTAVGALIVYYRNYRLWNPEPGVVAKLEFVRRTQVETVVQEPADPLPVKK